MASRGLQYRRFARQAGLEYLPEHVVVAKMGQDRGADSLDKVMKKTKAAKKDG